MSAAQDTLRVVDAGLFTYSTVTPRLDARGQALGTAAFATLRSQRDKLRAWISAAGDTVDVPPPAYDLGPLPDQDAARRAALRAEEALAAAFAVLVLDSSAARRDIAASWLCDTAARAVQWRGWLGISPTTVAFPGLLRP